LRDDNDKEKLMRGTLHLWLILTIASAGAGCGQAEKAGQAPASERSSAPAVTRDPRPPLAMFDSPKEGETVSSKSWCTGWALDDSGIFQVTGTTDTGAVAPARLGFPFPGVKEAYPNMPENEKAGFMLQIPDLPPGPHSLKLEVVAKDGGRTVLTRSFNVK
jgi:hypothetical protein